MSEIYDLASAARRVRQLPWSALIRGITSRLTFLQVLMWCLASGSHTKAQC
jgi:hypothetical protein